MTGYRIGEGRAKVWTARYTVTASDETAARQYIAAAALRDVPDASVTFIRGPVRDRGERSYWRATVKRERSS